MPLRVILEDGRELPVKSLANVNLEAIADVDYEGAGERRIRARASLLGAAAIELLRRKGLESLVPLALALLLRRQPRRIDAVRGLFADLADAIEGRGREAAWFRSLRPWMLAARLVTREDARKLRALASSIAETIPEGAKPEEIFERALRVERLVNGLDVLGLAEHIYRVSFGDGAFLLLIPSSGAKELAAYAPPNRVGLLVHGGERALDISLRASRMIGRLALERAGIARMDLLSCRPLIELVEAFIDAWWKEARHRRLAARALAELRPRLARGPRKLLRLAANLALVEELARVLEDAVRVKMGLRPAGLIYPRLAAGEAPEEAARHVLEELGPERIIERMLASLPLRAEGGERAAVAEGGARPAPSASMQVGHGLEPSGELAELSED